METGGQFEDGQTRAATSITRRQRLLYICLRSQLPRRSDRLGIRLGDLESQADRTEYLRDERVCDGPMTHRPSPYT